MSKERQAYRRGIRDTLSFIAMSMTVALYIIGMILKYEGMI